MSYSVEHGRKDYWEVVNSQGNAVRKFKSWSNAVVYAMKLNSKKKRRK